MLLNRAVTIGLVKTPKQEISGETKPLIIDPATITQFGTEIKRAAVILGILYASKVLLNTASKATIISLEAKLLK
jgi:hypothetical protein